MEAIASDGCGRRWRWRREPEKETSMAKIEPASADDHPAIHRLARILYGDDVRPYTPVRQASRTFVARRDGEVAGFLICTFSDYGITRSGQIDELAVSEAAQGEGIGRDLLDTCTDWLRSEGIEVVFVSAGLEAEEDRQLSERFYSRMGFKRCIGPWLALDLTKPAPAAI
jgi:ribosomal protein S18 acetylase RimI-like enzyme